MLPAAGGRRRLPRFGWALHRGLVSAPTRFSLRSARAEWARSRSPGPEAAEEASSDVNAA